MTLWAPSTYTSLKALNPVSEAPTCSLLGLFTALPQVSAPVSHIRKSFLGLQTQSKLSSALALPFPFPPLFTYALSLLTRTHALGEQGLSLGLEECWAWCVQV